jgi:carboxyl-terminal processing protease
MLTTLKDSHTIFLPPVPASKDAATLAGETGGVGAVVRMNDANQVVIAEARRGWPAERAGVKAGDIILAVDGKSVNGLTLNQAVDLVRGPLGSEVELTLKRANVAQPLVLKMTRAQINVFGEMLDNNIAYISLNLFDKTSPDEVTKQLNDLLGQQHPRALIFDLRGNGGGLLDSGLKIADLFLPAGLVATEKDAFGENLRFESKTGEIGEKIPMVVLVDANTASASEIVSGALQDRKRAVLIGQRTYGKGSVQSLHTLSDGSQLRVTTGAWYTPNETPIEHQGDQAGGLMPDVQVTLPDKPTPGVDPVMDAAIQYVKAHYWLF